MKAKGIIRTATPEMRKNSPIRAGIVDGSFFILSTVGLNAVDNIVATAIDENATSDDVATEIYNGAMGNIGGRKGGGVKRTGPKAGSFDVDRELPRRADGTPDPSADGASGAHTQLGKKEGRSETYNQAREFDADGNVVKDIDFTDHGRPGQHTNPHQHRYTPNETGGTPKRGKAEPLKNE